MKAILRIACLAIVLIIALPMVSCGDNAPKLDDVKENFIYLIEGSRELNHVFFGIGLPVYRRGDSLSERKMVYFTDELPGYNRVMESSSYFSVDEIKADAERIYSADYLSALYESAFDGIIIGNSGAYLRFYDNGEWLYQNASATDFGLSERIYDYSTMKIVKPSEANYVNVSIECYSLANQNRVEYILSFVFENGGWRLDSPTY